MDENIIIISLKETSRQTSLSTSQIKVLVKQGKFPAIVRISPWRIGFVQSEIRAWVEARIAARASAADGNVQGTMTRQLERARAARKPTPITKAAAARRPRGLRGPKG